MITRMTQGPDAVIYLSDSRGCTQNKTFRSFHTFNYGTLYSEHRKPFRRLITFNDETLAGGTNVLHLPIRNSMVIVLPLAGDVVCEASTGKNAKVGAGQACLFALAAGQEVSITNPFAEEHVNYLYIELETNGIQGTNDLVTHFDLYTSPDTLLSLFTEVENFSMQIGQFTGRHDDVFVPPANSKGMFVFVIDGEFEAANRLLHMRDALSIDKTEQLEFEALSNEAVLLIISL